MKILYSFFDRIAGVYSAPFVGDRKEAVIRGVKLAIAQGGQQPWQVYPDDNDLFALAEMDDCTGRIVPYDVPQFICHLTDIKEAN